MTIQVLNTLHHTCEPKRTQLLNILAMTVQNFQLAGYFLTGNHSNFCPSRKLYCWVFDCLGMKLVNVLIVR